MKKYLIYLSLLISFFIFSNNVKAESTPKYDITYTENAIQNYKYYQDNSDRYTWLNSSSTYVDRNGYLFYDTKDRYIIIADHNKSYFFALQGDNYYTFNNFMSYQVSYDCFYLIFSEGEGVTNYAKSGTQYYKANSDTFFVKIGHDNNYVNIDMTKTDIKFRNADSEDGFTFYTITRPWADDVFGLASSYDLYTQSSFSSTTKTKIYNKTFDILDIIPIAEFNEVKKNTSIDFNGNEYVSSIDFLISFNVFNEKYKYYYGYESDDITNEITENNKIINVDHNCNLYVKITKDDQVYYYSLTVTGIENNVTSEDVEFSHTGKDGTEKKYNKLLKIPVSKFYDKKNNTWKDYNLTFLSKEMNSVESNFYITLHSNKTSGIDLPLLVSFRENIDDITVEHSTIKDLADSINQDILNGVDIAKSSVDNKCQISNLPIEKDVFNDNSTYYNKIMFYVTQCDFLKNKTLDDIKNDYIYVYYNARIYESKSSLDKKYEDNPGEFTEANDFASFMMKSLNFFITPIQTIFRLITIFFNNLPYKVRYCIFACFVLVLALAIFRFLL